MLLNNIEVLEELITATEQEIIDYCAGKLAKYKLPTIVEFRKELPKSCRQGFKENSQRGGDEEVAVK